MRVMCVHTNTVEQNPITTWLRAACVHADIEECTVWPGQANRAPRRCRRWQPPLSMKCGCAGCGHAGMNFVRGMFKSSVRGEEGGFRCYVGGRVDTSGHFFTVSNHKVFHDVAFRSSLARFFCHVNKVSFVKNAFVFSSHTNTQEHDVASTHSDNDTDQKHHKSLHFRTHLDQSRNCLYLLSRITVCAIESLLLSKGMGRGSSWSSLDLETLESESADAIAKDRGWPSSRVRQRVAAINQVMSVGAHGV